MFTERLIKIFLNPGICNIEVDSLPMGQMDLNSLSSFGTMSKLIVRHAHVDVTWLLCILCLGKVPYEHILSEILLYGILPPLSSQIRKAKAKEKKEWKQLMDMGYERGYKAIFFLALIMS